MSAVGPPVQDVGRAVGPPVQDVGRLYRDFSRRLQVLVRGDVRACDAVIEDACQAAWAQLLRYRHHVALESAPCWLTKTAVREAVKLNRRHERECSLELVLAEEPRLSERDRQNDVLAQRERLLELRLLPRRQQRMVWLKALGLSYDEVASQEACTFRTVERQLDQARQRLRVLD